MASWNCRMANILFSAISPVSGSLFGLQRKQLETLHFVLKVCVFKRIKSMNPFLYFVLDGWRDWLIFFFQAFQSLSHWLKCLRKRRLCVLLFSLICKISMGEVLRLAELQWQNVAFTHFLQNKKPRMKKVIYCMVIFSSTRSSVGLLIMGFRCSFS